MDEMRVETRLISTSLVFIFCIRHLYNRYYMSTSEVCVHLTLSLSLSVSDIDEMREETRLDFISCIRHLSTDTAYQHVNS